MHTMRTCDNDNDDDNNTNNINKKSKVIKIITKKASAFVRWNAFHFVEEEIIDFMNLA